jgi:hypothetical protein
MASLSPLAASLLLRASKWTPSSLIH